MWSVRAIGLAAATAAALVFGACRKSSPGNTGGADGAAAAAESAGMPGPAAGEVATSNALQATSSPIDLRGIGHDVGAPTAKVAIVEFADFGCPYCGQFARDVWPTIRKEYVETGKVRWKFVPFVMGMFPNGAEAARAGECAAAQGDAAFWAMSDRLFQGQPEWKMARDPRPVFDRYVRELHLNGAAFAACYSADAARSRTAAANDASNQLGVRATPTFFVNGAKLEGALPLADFRAVLRQAGAD